MNMTRRHYCNNKLSLYHKLPLQLLCVKRSSHYLANHLEPTQATSRNHEHSKTFQNRTTCQTMGILRYSVDRTALIGSRTSRYQAI